jgi:hypothetical protein
MIVAIHQPNFFPWLGYFDKIVHSDAFIILDNVQLPKTNGTWSNRVKVMSSGEPRWITADLDRNYNGVRNINEMRFVKIEVWQKKILATLTGNYKKTPFYKELFPFFENLILFNNSNVAEYNINAILSILKMLSIDTDKLYFASKLGAEGSSNDLLITLTKLLGGTTYLSGGGAEGYQDDELFAAANIELRPQNFSHPNYFQLNETFHPGLSIIDAFMNIGTKGVAELLLPKI